MSAQEILNIPQGEMIALDRQDGFFIVKSGSLILLKSQTHEDAPLRRQTRISTVQPGGILLGDLSAGDSGYLLEALTLEESEIRFVSFANLALGDDDLDRLISGLHSLYSLDNHRLSESNPKSIESDTENPVSIVKGESFKASGDSVSWLQVSEGRLAFCGEDEIHFNRTEHFIPISSHLWFTALEPVKVRCLSEVPPDNFAVMGECIGLFQAAILKRIESLERQGDKAEFERLTKAKQIQD